MGVMRGDVGGCAPLCLYVICGLSVCTLALAVNRFFMSSPRDGRSNKKDTARIKKLQKRVGRSHEGNFSRRKGKPIEHADTVRESQLIDQEALPQRKSALQGDATINKSSTKDNNLCAPTQIRWRPLVAGSPASELPGG